METIDWGDGDYGRIARTLMPVAELAAKRAGAAPRTRVADVACGTGNVALAAARCGASAVGVDAAPGLVAVAEERAAADAPGADLTFVVGDAAALPLDDAAFDAAVSVFGVIFAPDPAAAASELVRVVRPGGTVVITGWIPEGQIAEVGRVVAAALGVDRAGHPPRRPWAELLADAGATDATEVTEHGVPFTAASPAAWFDEQGEHHPVWRAARSRLDAGVWAELRETSIAALAAGNQDAAGFRTTSPYLMTCARRPPATAAD